MDVMFNIYCKTQPIFLGNDCEKCNPFLRIRTRKLSPGSFLFSFHAWKKLLQKSSSLEFQDSFSEKTSCEPRWPWFVTLLSRAIHTYVGKRNFNQLSVEIKAEEFPFLGWFSSPFTFKRRSEKSVALCQKNTSTFHPRNLTTKSFVSKKGKRLFL